MKTKITECKFWGKKKTEKKNHPTCRENLQVHQPLHATTEAKGSSCTHCCKTKLKWGTCIEERFWTRLLWFGEGNKRGGKEEEGRRKWQQVAPISQLLPSLFAEKLWNCKIARSLFVAFQKIKCNQNNRGRWRTEKADTYLLPTKYLEPSSLISTAGPR